MKVDIRYGRTGLTIDLPDDRTDVIRPLLVAPAADPVATIGAALDCPLGRAPLRELAANARRVAISVCDHTRPQPRREVLEAILCRLPKHSDLAVTVLVATGTHRGSTPDELLEMFGPDLLSRVRVVNHDCCDPGLVDLGVVHGDVPVRLARAWVEADLRITTGFVEPHFFAGFSGGPKMVAPGLAGLDTIQALHNAARIGSPEATWGRTTGNPVHDAIRAAAALAPPHLACDVLLDGGHRIAEAVAGELEAAHAEACRRCAARSLRPVSAPYAVVVASNAGFPLDQNLYQAVKGMRAAAPIVAAGGTIVVAAACADGLPAPSPFADRIAQGLDPDAVLAEVEAADPPTPDQWQLQVMAQTQKHATIGVHCDGVDEATLRLAGLAPVPDIGRAVTELLDAAGPDARVCVLPEGPETMAYVDPATS